MVATRGYYLPLIGADDAHYYDNDACVAWIMVEADSSSQKDLLAGIRRGAFYATQGPEIHLRREGDLIILNCSPVCGVAFLSNVVWGPGKGITGKNITEARYTLQKGERYVRAEVIDENGKKAWSQILPIEENK